MSCYPNPTQFYSDEEAMQYEQEVEAGREWEMAQSEADEAEAQNYEGEQE